MRHFFLKKKKFNLLNKYKVLGLPVCPCNFCTISLVCKFHIYTILSSEPLTIHLPPVTEKLANIQYFSFLCPEYVLRHFPFEQSHNFKVLSNVAAKIYFPFGENFTKDTGGLSSSINVFRHWPDAVSQIRLEYSRSYYVIYGYLPHKF